MKKGNYGFLLEFTVKKADGTAFDLTGYTVTLKVWQPGAAACKFTGTCTVTDAVNGKCQYQVASSNFDAEGSYVAELELTKTGVVEDTGTFPVLVEPTAP